MSEWGKGVLNNNIGWGQGFNNTINWGAIYASSYRGQTVISEILNLQSIINNFKTRVANDGGTFEAESNLLSILTSVNDTVGLSKVNMLLTPNAFKTGKAYNVIGATDFAMLRNTIATRVNSAGLIVTESSNIMRINYLSGTPIILDELQATNFIKFSNTITDSSWNNGATNVTRAVAPTSPHLTEPAYRLTSTTSTSFSRISIGTVDIGSGVNNVATRVYLRADVPFTASLRRRAGSTQVALIDIDVTTVWKPFDILTSTSGTSHDINILLNASGLAGNSVIGRTLDVFNVQMEEGVVNTSNIFTDSAATTRNEDLLTVTPPAGTVRITTTFLNNTTQVLNTIPATFTLPTGQIRQVVFQNSL